MKLERIIAVRVFVEKEIEVDIAVPTEKMAHPDIATLLLEFDIAEIRPSSLVGGVGNAIAGSGRDANGIGKPILAIHQVVQDADGKDSPHTTAFQHKSRLIIYRHG